jgi:hypothetical protein
MAMKTKSTKGKIAKTTAGKAGGTARRGSTGKTEADKLRIKDPVGRYMYDHFGALGKDYKLDY